MPKNKIQTLYAKTPNQIYRYGWTDSAGKRNQMKSYKGETKKDFSLRCDKADEGHDINERMTVAELYEKWHDSVLILNSSKADIDQVEWSWDKYINMPIGHLQICDVKRYMLNDLLSLAATTPKKAPKCSSKEYRMKLLVEPEYLSESSLKHIRGTLTRMFNYAVLELEININNPAVKLTIVPKVVIYEKDEDEDVDLNSHFVYRESLERLFSIPSNFRLAIELILYTGLRPSEVLALKWKNISKGVIRIRRGITKYGDSILKSEAAVRDIPLSEPAIDLFHEQSHYLKEIGHPHSVYVFPLKSGKKPTMSALCSTFARMVSRTKEWKKIGRKYHGESLRKPVDFTMYDLRHTFATMAAHIMDVKKLQYIMGHADISTTLNIYAEIEKHSVDEIPYDISNMWGAEQSPKIINIEDKIQSKQGDINTRVK